MAKTERTPAQREADMRMRGNSPYDRVKRDLRQVVESIRTRKVFHLAAFKSGEAISVLELAIMTRTAAAIGYHIDMIIEDGGGVAFVAVENKRIVSDQWNFNEFKI